MTTMSAPHPPSSPVWRDPRLRALTEDSGYEIASRIGAGGMGIVYRALDSDGRDVAIKLLRPEIADDPRSRERLAREVAAQQRVRNDNIARILDAELDSSEAFVVTEFVPGPTLEEAIRTHGPLHPESVRELGLVLGDALAEIHAAGVVHRDLKPSNILLRGATDADLTGFDPDGARLDPVIIDFGIAQAAEESRLTSTGLVMGTAAYLDPEVVSTNVTSSASDWWSWAALLVFAATGREPFGSGRADLVFLRAERGELDVEGLPTQLAVWLRDALRPRPADRLDPDELRERLDGLDLDAYGPLPDGEDESSAHRTGAASVGAGTPAAPAAIAVAGGAATTGTSPAGATTPIPGAASPPTEVLGNPVDGRIPGAPSGDPATEVLGARDRRDEGDGAPHATQVLPAYDAAQDGRTEAFGTHGERPSSGSAAGDGAAQGGGSDRFGDSGADRTQVLTAVPDRDDVVPAEPPTEVLRAYRIETAVMPVVRGPEDPGSLESPFVGTHPSATPSQAPTSPTGPYVAPEGTPHPARQQAPTQGSAPGAYGQPQQFPQVRPPQTRAPQGHGVPPGRPAPGYGTPPGQAPQGYGVPPGQPPLGQAPMGYGLQGYPPMGLPPIQAPVAPPRRRLLVWTGHLLLVALAAVAPFVAVILFLLLGALARTWERSHKAIEGARARGKSAGASWAVGIAGPFRFLLGLLETALMALLPAVLGVLVVVAADAVVSVTTHSPLPSAVLYGGAMAIMLIVTWVGFGGETTRNGAHRLLDAAAPDRVWGLVVGVLLVLLLVAVGAVIASRGGAVDPFPFVSLTLPEHLLPWR